MTHDAFQRGEPYELFMGRWSRRMAEPFVSWLDVPDGRRWIDVGCGTGALTAAILDAASPAEVLGIDPSEGFVETARRRIGDPRARFDVGDAGRLDLPDGACDATVGGLMLNFVPDPAAAAAELARVTAPDGVVAVYVWDYADGQEMLSHFWAAAAALDPAADAMDEGQRFPLCRPEPLRQLWENTGLADVTVEALEMPMDFADFDDYWTPFLGGQGPAPSYAVSLPVDRRAALREELRRRLPVGSDGSIPLAARAWAVRGRR